MDEVEQLKKELDEARVELQKGRYALMRIFHYVDEDYNKLKQLSDKALKMVGTRKRGENFFYSRGILDSISTFQELHEYAATILKQQDKQ